MSNREEKKSRNVQALLDIHKSSMSTQMAAIRGRLLYEDYYDSLLVGSAKGSGQPETEMEKRREELHGLLGIYESLGATTRSRLLHEDLVFTMFPRSIPACYAKTSGYISRYRIEKNHPNFAASFEWLALRYPTN